MTKIIEKIEPYSTVILRYGMGFVFIWFGYGSIVNPETWVRLVPDFMSNIVPAQTLIRGHGVFEVIGGLMLFFGLYTRIVSFILALNLLVITNLVSGPTAVRDFGLSIALLSLAFTKTK